MAAAHEDPEMGESGRGRPAAGGVLSALDLADEVARRAARLGFDWPNVDGPLAKVEEELAELRAALGAEDSEGAKAELGDLLFAVANVARHLDVSSEQALRGTIARFEARFAHVEASVQGRGSRMDEVGLPELEAEWELAKSKLG